MPLRPCSAFSHCLLRQRRAPVLTSSTLLRPALRDLPVPLHTRALKRRLLQKSEGNFFRTNYRVNFAVDFWVDGFCVAFFLGKNRKIHPKIHGKIHIRIWKFRSQDPHCKHLRLKKITELIQKQFRFGNSSTQIIESNSQNNSVRDSPILSAHFLQSPSNSNNKSVR